MKAKTPRWVGTAAALAAMLQLLPSQAAPAQVQPVRLQAATNHVGLFEKIEFRLEVPGTWTNPFDPDEVEVSLQLASPGGGSVTVPAFYCQDFERQRLSPQTGSAIGSTLAGTPAGKRALPQCKPGTTPLWES